MKKRTLLFLFTSLLLTSCNNKFEYSVFCEDSDYTCPFGSYKVHKDIYWDYRQDGSHSLGLFDIKSISQSEIVLKKDNKKSGLKAINIECQLIEDIYQLETENRTINFLYYLNYECGKTYDFSTVFNFFNDLDKVVIFYKTSNVTSGFQWEDLTFNGNDSNKFFSNDILTATYLNALPIKDNKIYWNSYNENIVKANSGARIDSARLDNDKIHGGMTVEELKEELVRIGKESEKYKKDFNKEIYHDCVSIT